jgi:hypothetical protein
MESWPGLGQMAELLQGDCMAVKGTTRTRKCSANVVSLPRHRPCG